MSVTTILFRKGNPATVAGTGNIGEPLWNTGTKQLYVSDGNDAVLIGPIQQVQADWTQLDSTAVDFIKNKPTIPAAQVNADWNASSGVAEILNKPTIPDAVTYTAVGTTSAGIHTIGTLTIGTTPYSLTCPAPTISGTNDGTNWTSITIGNDTYSIPSGGGQTTGRDDELTASEHNDQTADGSIDMYTAANPTAENKPKVTLRHKAQTNGSGTYAEFSISQSSTSTNKIVEVEITVIDGGSW